MTLTGAVLHEGKPMPHEHIVIAPWPLRLANGYPDFLSTETGGNGEFTIAKLAPGTYRITSAGPVEWSRKDVPNAVAGWLASAEEITLADRETRTMQLEQKLP